MARVNVPFSRVGADDLNCSAHVLQWPRHAARRQLPVGQAVLEHETIAAPDIPGSGCRCVADLKGAGRRDDKDVLGSFSSN